MATKKREIKRRGVRARPSDQEVERRERQRALSSQNAIEMRERKRAMPARNAFTYTIKDAQAMGLPGRTTIWKMIKAKKLEVQIVGGMKMLTGESVRRVLGVKEEAAA